MITFEISKTNPLPLHTQLLDDLRHKVLTGVFKPHDRLPGEWELAELLDISRTTIQRAWQGAEEEKLIYRIAGKGTFVSALGDTAPMRMAVGLVLPDFRSSTAARQVYGAERVLRQKGYQLQVAGSEYSVEEENRVLSRMRADNIQGFIVWAAQSDDSTRLLSQLSQSIPTVLLDRPVASLHLPCISSNNYAGGIQAMQHLIALGHRNIAFFARPHLNLLPVAERYRAYRDALIEIGEKPRAPILIGTDQELSSHDAYLTSDDNALVPLITILNQPDRPTAIFAVNDWMAIRILRATAAIGMRIPDDLSLVGFDDLDVSSVLSPPLTTVAQNSELLGAEAAHRLLHSIGGESAEEVLTLVPTKLIVRASTGPIR